MTFDFDGHNYFECDCDSCETTYNAFSFGMITATVSALKTLSTAVAIADRDKLGVGARRDLANYAVAVNRLLQAEMQLDADERINALAQYTEAETALTDRLGHTGFEAGVEVFRKMAVKMQAQN